MAITERAKGLEYGGTTVKKDEQKRKGVISLGLQQIIAKNQNAIVQKFQSLLTNYSNNVTNFYNEVSKRYEGRAFDFNDNYVSDAGAWNESTKQKVDSLKAEKTELENYINSYGSLFDEQWVSQITSSINSNSKYLDNILKNAQADADYWGSFESADAYNKWATKEKNYYNNWGKYADAEDFKYFSELGNNIENPTHAEAIGWGHLHGIFTGNDYYFGGEKVNNKVTFVKENYGTLALGNDSNETLGYLKYNQMTDEEVGVYNYLLAKYGEAKAEEYLDYLDNENLVNASLTQREAGELAQNIQNLESGFFKTLVYAGTSLASGISQNIQNFAQFFQEDVRPTTQIEYQNQYLQQDLTGAAKYLYQAGNTIGNMLPSIAISIATGGAGAALGSLQMGASAAGGAYAQAIKEGYSVGQARLYSTLVGAAEGGLQYALGGISKLGGKALGSLATKAGQIENVFLRVAAKTGLSLGGEILEEELQNFIEPLLKTIIMGEEYDAPTWSELLETAIVTAISTGVLEGASIAGYEVSAAENKKLYAGQEQQIVDRLLEIDADNVYAQRIKENLDKGKTLSGNQITQIIQQTFDREVELKKQAVKYNRQIAKAEKQGLYPTLENFEVKDAENTTPTQDQETGYKLLEKPSSNKMGATTQNALKTDDYEGTELLDIEKPKAEQPKVEEQKNNVQAKSKVKAEAQPKTETKTATTIEEVSKKYGKQATAMAKAYLPNQDVNEYAKAFDKVYEYAKSGASLSSIWKLLDIGVLTDTQVEIAYEMGDYASKEAAKEQDAKNKKLGDNKTRKKGVVAGDGVSIDELSKSFNDTQRKAYKTMQYIAEATGVNIVFFKSEIKDGKFVGEQGRYERAKKGTIFIDINAGLNNEMDVQDLSNYTMLRTFTHEFTHFIEDLNPQQYNELRKAVFERLEQQGVDVEALIEAQQSYGLSVEQASREVVAEAMADILPDSTFIETLANKHKNIFEKLLDKLKEFLANIKAYFESINKNIPEEARAMKESVGESVRYVENIVKLFDKAAIGAVENLQKVEQQQAETNKKEILTDNVVQRQNREYDTNGNKLSQKQSEYFADSLITDNNGNLKTVYHGSSRIFTKFDHSFIGEHGSMEGQGFYFTDKKEVAEGYQRKGGQLLEGYLNITKPLSDSEVTLQKAEVRKLLREIDPTGDDIVINYDSLGGLGYPSKTWYERALNDTVNSLFKYSETDSEILADISNSGGQRDVILKVRDILGYDGYIVKNKYDGADVYVAFDSNQFKLASNKNPTADEDIQLQRRENLTNREILELMTVSFNAEEMSQLTDAELDALEIFKKQTTEIYELQEMRLQEGAVFVENQFKKDGDRKLAQEAKNRVAIIDEKIKKATDRLMQIQEAEVIKKILPKARKIVGRYERIQTKQLASQYRKETREKINEVKEQAKAEKFDALARYRERMQIAATIKKYKERIEADVKELTKWIVSPDNKNYLKHVPDVLKDAVVPFLESIDFTSKRQLRGGEETIADKKFVKQLNALMKAFKGTTDVEKMYSGYYDLPADFIENLQYFIDATQDLVGSIGGDHIINKMTAEELASLSKVVRALKHFIPQVNKFHNNAMYQHVYEAGDETIATLKKSKTSTAGELDNFLFWKNTRPMDGFERMGKGAKSIFLGLEKGQEQLAKNTKEIIDFTENAYTRKEVKEWEQELHTIEIEENGEKVTFQMTTSQIMGFYCLANQQDSLQHMDNGGIRIPTMKIKWKKYASEEHKVSRTDIKNIISKLTDRQKAVADKLQKYMATKGAEWGNHVSLARFGEKLFTNPDYYPINSDGRHLESMADKELSGASLYALLNMSFTKSRNQLANNTILVYSIFDVFANHMASMAQYNAMALPVLDAIKWLNYEQKGTTAEGKRIVKGSVKGEMDRAFGVPEETKSSGKMGYAQSFVSNIIKSFNGTESFSSANDSLGLKALHIYNRAQIAFNLRVVIQQPLSIVRAGQIISYKSILKGLKASPKQAKANVEEMLNHSGIALWKSLGFYDVNVSRGLTSLIKHDETFIDKVTEAGMFLAEKADERTWAAMWSACKEEVIAKGTAPTDAKFFDKVNELFAEVIHKTQVVDSTLTKTEYMRDKGFFPRAMSSFMSEPITSASMVFNAFFNYRTDLQRGVSPKQAWENNKNNIARTVVVYGLSQTLLAVVQSFQDAARDDDDYETYLQKFGEALKSNLVDEASLLGKIPVVKNFLEFAKEMLATWFPNLGIYGNEPPTVFAQWGDAIIKGSKILHDRITGKDTNYTTYSWVFKLLQGLSGAFGLPLANITREIITLLNNTVGRFAPSLKVKSYDPGEKNSIKYAYRDGYLSEEEAIDLLVKQGMDKDDAYFFIQQEGKYDALYESILSGEGYAEAVEHLTEHGVTMDNITSTARSQIHKWLNEATITQDKAIELLVTYGELKKDVAQSRVEFWVVKHENNLEGFTEAAYNKYLKECAKSGMDVKVFYNAWQYKNEVDDKRKTLDYIYTLDIPQNQKRALIMCFY